MAHPSTPRYLSLACAFIILGIAHAEEARDLNCQASAEEAATAFVRLSIEDAQRSTSVLTSSSLARFRARLEQLMDDRYAPDSRPLRSRLLGTDKQPDELRSISNSDYVGLYLSAGALRRTAVRLIDVRPVSRRRDRYLGEEVVVSYRVAAGESERSQERTLFASTEGSCWKVDAPVEAWVRLEQLAKVLKESRSQPQYTYKGPSTVRLRVAPAWDISSPNSTEYRMPKRSNASVWVSDVALATERDVAGTSAYWDCDAGRDPEHPAVMLRLSERGAAKLQDWSARNFGSMLAVVIENEVVVYARVAGTLKDRISVCMAGKSLEDAAYLAKALVGSR